MLAVKQRVDDDVKTHGLALLGRTCDEQMRGVGKVKHLDFLGDGISNRYRKFCLALAKIPVVEQGLE